MDVIDLERIRLERAEKCENEHFMFTLLDKDGKRMHGMCMRSLFQGECGRHDVKRRPRHCLCIISRHPFISLFRTLLLEIHALGMLDQDQSSVRTFVEQAYNQSLSMIRQNTERVILSRSTLSVLIQDYNIVSPKTVRLSRVATILPLLEALGVEKFLLILSAVLCERRIIFIADETSTLLTSVLALGAMLHPFQWQHVFIPLVPSKLLSYTAAKIPYIMGVRRYLYQQLLREPLDDVILVDIDKGDYRVMGGVCIRDFVGESGTALKQASESLDRVRQRASDMASMFLRSTGASSGSGQTQDSDGSPRDMVAIIVSELRAALAAKPGGSSVTAVASGLFRGLPGVAKSTVEESKGQWALETEKLIRDTLMQFFVYLFADIEEFLFPPSANTEGSPRAYFDRNAYLNKRSSASIGDSRSMLEFLYDFLQSNMFSKFCDEKFIEKKERDAIEKTGNAWGRGAANGGYTGGDEEDDFHAVCSDLRGRYTVNSVANVRSSVASRTALTASALNIDNSKGLVGMDFHPLTVQYTLGQRDGDASESSEAATSAAQQAIDRICSESHHTDQFSKIMHTIAIRLENCRAAACRGNGGLAGARALTLLRALLISGPECVLSASIDYIPVIRSILTLCGGGSPSAQSAESTSVGALADTRIIALAVLSLVLDHKKLSHQRKYSLQCREGVYPYILLQSLSSSSSLFSPLNHAKVQRRSSDALKRDLLVPCNSAGSQGSKQFPAFGSILNSFKPPGAVAYEAGKLILTEPVLASSEKRDDEDEDDANDGTESYSARDNVSKNTVVNLLDNSYDPTSDLLNPLITAPSTRPLTTFNPSPSAWNSTSTAFSPSVSAMSPPVEVFDEEAIYRIVNQDTGEVHDLRDLDKMMSMTKVVNTPMKHANVPILAPPPPPSQRRLPARNMSPRTAEGNVSDFSASVSGTLSSNNSQTKLSDPFSSLIPLIPNSPLKAPQSLSQTNQSTFTPSYPTPIAANTFFPSSSSSTFTPSQQSAPLSTGITKTFSLDSSETKSQPFTQSSGLNDAVNPFQGFTPTPPSFQFNPSQSTHTHIVRDIGNSTYQPVNDTGAHVNPMAPPKDPFADLLKY